MGAPTSFLLLLQTNATDVYPTGSLILVGVVLAVLGLLFLLMVYYSNRIAQTGPLGVQVKDAFYTVKQQQILKSLSEQWDSGKYHEDTVNNRDWLKENPLPDVPEGLEGDYLVEAARGQILERGRMGSLPPGLGGSSGSSAPQHEAQRGEYLGRLRHYERTLDQEARRRYRERQQASWNDARAATGSEVFRSFDFGSLWGQGPEFVLQFTAVVTIIFAVVALGILQQIGKDQAGTILAAIAGYVLGHATARATHSGNSPSEGPPGAQKVESSGGGGGTTQSASIPEMRTSNAASPK